MATPMIGEREIEGIRALTLATNDGGGVLAASFDFAGHRELMAAFPFPHEVLFEANLRGPTLTITTIVAASGDTPVPISFGYHPYLRVG